MLRARFLQVIGFWEASYGSGRQHRSTLHEIA
jgi:hypothetical protein